MVARAAWGPHPGYSRAGWSRGGWLAACQAGAGAAGAAQTAPPGPAFLPGDRAAAGCRGGPRCCVPRTAAGRPPTAPRTLSAAAPPLPGSRAPAPARHTPAAQPAAPRARSALGRPCCGACGPRQHCAAPWCAAPVRAPQAPRCSQASLHGSRGAKRPSTHLQSRQVRRGRVQPLAGHRCEVGAPPRRHCPLAARLRDLMGQASTALQPCQGSRRPIGDAL